MEVVNPTRIKVFGIGGGGSNAVNRMYLDGIEGVELFAINTDVQHLASLSVPNKIQIGEKVTRGLGAGARPEVGEQAALEDIDKIKEVLRNTDMLFLAVGLGGGTGTGAAPVIAETAKEMGILTVAVVTKPFNFEGQRAHAGRPGGFAHDNALIIFGAALEEDKENFMRVAIVATDFENAVQQTQLRVIKKEQKPLQKVVPESTVEPVQPDIEELPAYLRRKKRI
jgi:cell division GTPase FtsZ